jgi:hypothetical protein
MPTRFFLFAPLLLLLCQCTTSLKPGHTRGWPGSEDVATNLIENASRKAGDTWQKSSKVQVAFTGEWSGIATRIQPTLTDPGYRIQSIETYDTRNNTVTQIHKGPMGTKTVRDLAPSTTSVSYDGSVSNNQEIVDAAALVADCYRLFLFGASWLKDNATDFRLIGHWKLHGKPCDLVACVVAPGFGNSRIDHVICWIERDTGLLKRIQFSLNGLESTKGADADVTYTELLATPRGIWPVGFVEFVRRPFVFKAHEWKTTSLVVDGVPLK